MWQVVDGLNHGRNGLAVVREVQCAPELWCTRQVASGQLHEPAQISLHTGVGKPSEGRGQVSDSSMKTLGKASSSQVTALLVSPIRATPASATSTLDQSTAGDPMAGGTWGGINNGTRAKLPGRVE